MQPGFESPYPRQLTQRTSAQIRLIAKTYWLSQLSILVLMPTPYSLLAFLNGFAYGIWVAVTLVVVHLILGVYAMIYAAKVYDQPSWFFVSVHFGSNLLPILMPLVIYSYLSLSMNKKLKKSGVRTVLGSAWPKDIKARCEELDREHTYSNARIQHN